ncbi:MAG: DUF3127 domain-containing protein [Prevotella sp.]|nr:DUF3127 domain-containing protein [Prevotella sp.]
MEIQGNIFKVGAVQSGTSRQGNPYTTQEVVVEYFEYPTDMWTQKIVLQLRGQNIESYHLNVGDKVKVRFGLNVREWEGRFFQEIRLAQDGIQVISRLGQQAEPQSAAKAADTVVKPEAQAPNEQEVQADDLPF